MDRKSIILDRQNRVFRIAQDPTRYGLTLKMIAADADIKPDSLRNYAAGETEMPLSALTALIGVLPDELLSLLLPTDRAIIRVPEGIDHDELERRCRDYLRLKGEVHHPESPAQRDISDCETEKLNLAAAMLQVVS